MKFDNIIVTISKCHFFFVKIVIQDQSSQSAVFISFFVYFLSFYRQQHIYLHGVILVAQTILYQFQISHLEVLKFPQMNQKLHDSNQRMNPHRRCCFLYLQIHHEISKYRDNHREKKHHDESTQQRVKLNLKIFLYLKVKKKSLHSIS